MNELYKQKEKYRERLLTTCGYIHNDTIPLSKAVRGLPECIRRHIDPSGFLEELLEITEKC